MKNIRSYLTICFFILSCKTARYNKAIPIKDSILQIPYHTLTNEDDLDVLIKEIGNSKIVLLGEASHGTSEYYTWRSAISKKLIEQKGFNFIAVEGDWTDSYKVNNFIKGEKKDTAAVITLLKEYNRWPTWLWANYEVASLVTWLSTFNQNRTIKDKIGFYGLDVFNIGETANEIIPHLNLTDTAAINAVKKFRQCFKPFYNDEQQYSKSSSRANFNCGKQAKDLLQSVAQLFSNRAGGSEADLAMLQSAMVVFDGEMYLRTAAGNTVNAWNFRDNHMVETINRLLKFYGENSKAIIWAHNNHVGDAQYATLRWRGKTNVGQLLRNQFGSKNIFIVGFGSYGGSLIAAEKWGNSYQTMRMAVADDSSWEQKMHQLSPVNKLIISKELQNNPSFSRWISNIGIGVTYHPMDRYGIYSLSVLPKRYDAFLFFENTTALHPIQSTIKAKETPGKTGFDY